MLSITIHKHTVLNQQIDNLFTNFLQNQNGKRSHFYRLGAVAIFQRKPV